MKEQLFINGIEADLKPGNAITLNFKSNFMGDISKIVASNSLTISLPKTTRNNIIFSGAGMPASNSRAPYIKLPAKYYRDGVEVIPVAQCALVDVGESYNVALYWGTMANFKEWTESDATLQQLDYSDVPNSSYYWGDKPVSKYDDRQAIVIADFDTGVGSIGSIPDPVAITPTIRVSSLIEKIEQQNGIRFSFALREEDMPPIAKMSILDALGVPLTTSRGKVAQELRASSVGIQSDVEKYGPPSPGTWTGEYGLSFTVTDSAYHETSIETLYMPGSSIQSKVIIPIASGILRVTPSITIRTAYSNKSSEITPMVELYVVSLDSNGNYYSRKRINSSNSNDGYTKIWTFGGDGSKYYLEITDGGRFGFMAVTDNARVVDVSGHFDMRLPEAETDEINKHDTYNVQDNLPDMKQIDFIKAIANMLGLYAVQTVRPSELRIITFSSIDSMMKNKRLATDWTNKLVRGQIDGSPENISFKIDDWAKNNKFEYSEDDSVLNNGEGNLVVPNENLEASRDALQLPFAASDWSVVPIYAYGSDGKIERKDIKPRIMRIVGKSNGDAALTFEGLGWPSLLNKYYGSQSRMLNQVVVIKEKVRLSAIDLKNLSFVRPVYLAQYGRYYAIKSVSTSSSDVCNVELIQLAIDESNE